MSHLSKTVKNFIAQCSEGLVLRALELAFPLFKAIDTNNYKKVEHMAQKLKKNDFSSYLVHAGEVGSMRSLEILLTVFEQKHPQEFKHYRPDSVLLTAIEGGHTVCALHVLEQCQTEYKYEAFATAVKNNNQEFLERFVQRIPSGSTKWSLVLNQLVHVSNEELLLCAWNRCKIHDHLQLEHCARQHIEDSLARQQKQRIEGQLNSSPTARQTQRKM